MNKIFFKIIFFIAFVLIFQLNVNAQGEGNIWYFGSGNGVNFNQECDIADLSSSMDGLEGTVSLSDENGNLLFYTNGGRRIADPSSTGIIWNRNHEVMYDMGTTEGGGASSRQSSLAIPKPGDPNNYYLFTLDENEAINAGTFRGFSYFEIDMDLNGGLGGVVDYQESVTVFTFGNEGMAAVKRPDNNSYWLVTFGETGALNYYLIDENGVNLDHTQVILSTFSVSPFTFSPNGEYVSFGSIIFDFDAENGIFSNEINLTFAGVSLVGSAFSPNSRYFFCNSRVWKHCISLRYGSSRYSWIFNNNRYIITQYNMRKFIAFFQMAIFTFLHIDAVNRPDELSFSGILCPNSENPCVKEDVYVFPFESGSTLAPGLPNFTADYFMSDVVENGLEVCTEQSALQICDGEEVVLSVQHYLAETLNGQLEKQVTVFQFFLQEHIRLRSAMDVVIQVKKHLKYYRILEVL